MNNKEKEILIILQEECAEVIQEASKIFRFGFESCYPTDDSATSRERLTLELGQVLCMIGLLVERNVVDENAMLTAMEAKKIKLKKWSTIFDDEKEIILNSSIASLSIGAERKFAFKHKKSAELVNVFLEHGSLLVMKGETQTHWLHRLPPTTKISSPRINLTFRTIVG